MQRSLQKKIKVRDHDHYTGEYRGSACNKCNMNFHAKRFIPVFCHNMSGYISHLFIKTIGYEKGRLSCISHKEERYITFSRILVDKVNEKYVSIELRFLDSFNCMSSSLNKLASYLPKELFIETKKYFKDDVFFKKGVFPYEYITSFEKYNDTKLPLKDMFYGSVNNEDITEEEYERGKYIWNISECKNLGEYSDIYLKTDVLILADIFKNFRDVCMKSYDLDLCWYITCPGLAWDAMLKKTEIQLETLQDINMILMIEDGIRGGIS